MATYLVAEDYLSRCSPSMQSMVPAVIAAVKRWAGPDQAQGLSLAEWLHHRMQRLREFAHSKGEEGAEEERGAAGPNGSGREGARWSMRCWLELWCACGECVHTSQLWTCASAVCFFLFPSVKPTPACRPSVLCRAAAPHAECAARAGSGSRDSAAVGV